MLDMLRPWHVAKIRHEDWPAAEEPARKGTKPMTPMRKLMKCVERIALNGPQKFLVKT